MRAQHVLFFLSSSCDKQTRSASLTSLESRNRACRLQAHQEDSCGAKFAVIFQASINNVVGAVVVVLLQSSPQTAMQANPAITAACSRMFRRLPALISCYLLDGSLLRRAA